MKVSNILAAICLCATGLTALSSSVYASNDIHAKVTAKQHDSAKALAFTSHVLNATQSIEIYLPEGYEHTTEHIRYPVIYTLDGWVLSESVSGVIGHLGKTASMPKAIVVAITADNDYAYGPELYASNSGWGNDPAQRLSGFSGGKADQYLKFMQKELLPYIDSNYKTNEFRALIGMSPSATFTLHTFWKAPELFDAHFVFAATDVLGMGYSPTTTFVDKITESLAKNPDRKGFLYIASAQREAENKPVRLENIAALEKALAPYTAKNFRLRAEHIDNFGHYPMAIPGLLSAIDLVFPRKEWGMSGRFKHFVNENENALESVLSYYDKLSQSVGFKVYPNTDLRRNAACYRVMGYRLRNNKFYDESIDVYQQWIKDTPNVAKPYAGLAQTYAAKGEMDKALVAAEKSVKLATQNQSASLVYYQRSLDELRAKATGAGE